MGHTKKLLLGLVLVLALPEAVSPAAKERRLAGQFAITGDDLIEIRPVEEVIVDRVGDFRCNVQRVYEAVVEAATRGVIPENSIAFARKQHGDGDISIVLRDVDRFTVIVPHAGLVLSEAIERLGGSPQADESLGMVGLFAIHGHR